LALFRSVLSPPIYRPVSRRVYGRVLGFFWRIAQRRFAAAPLRSFERTAMYYYLLPIESMAGAIQCLFYLLTTVAAALTYIVIRQ
jgi:hypothetical protein